MQDSCTPRAVAYGKLRAMYFHDRAEAGDLLANQLSNYRYENTAVLALSPGGVLVGEQIARRLHCPMSMLLVAPITGPGGDESLLFGAIDQDGRYTQVSVNDDFMPMGSLEEYAQDLRNYIEEEKIQKMAELARLWGEYGEARTEQLAGRTIILATDGITNGASVMAASRYLSLIHVERIIGAIPVGTFEAIEQASHEVNELHYLYIPDEFISVDHYFSDNPNLDRDVIAERINNVVTRWL